MSHAIAPEVTPQPSSERNQISITLSETTLKEFREVAEWKGQPLATLLREVLEDYHRSPNFASALRRAKEANGAD